MQKNRFSYMARRDFLKLSAMACASLSLTACASLPASSVQTCSLPGECLLLDDKKEIRLANCNLVDIKTGKIIERAVVRMKDGLVIEAGKPMGELPPGAEVLNLNGRYVVPGLINAHLHMTLTPVSSFRWGMIFRALPLIKAAYTQSIASGITTVRDMAALPPILHHYKHATDRGSLAGPRVVNSNIWLGVKDGYMDLEPGDVTWFLDLVMAAVGPFKIDITDVSKQEKLLRKNCAEATYIKLASMDNKSLIAQKTVAAVHNLNQRLHESTGGRHPRSLKEIVNRQGNRLVTEEQMADIALKSIGDGAMFYNPEEMGEADCILVLKHAFEGIPLDNKLVYKG